MPSYVEEFEKRFASKIGAEYAIAVNSGTSALHAALEAIDVRHGEVIMPALCPGLVAFPIIHAGAWPVFADVDPQTQLITDETIRPLLGSRTKAVVVVALHGLPVDIDKINKLCGPKGIAVIEDCAQCLMGRYKDSYAGTKADIGCFSFEKKKHITTGSEGGMIVTQNQELAMRARRFAGLGYGHMDAGGGGTRVPNIGPDASRYSGLGFNYRMSEAQARIGLAELKNAQDKVWLRQEIGYLWQSVLQLQLQPHNYDADNTFYSAAWAPNFDTQSTKGRLGTWQGFHKQFCDAGGDGFYGMPRIPYDEEALKDYAGLNPNPVAVDLQQRLILFKTHYRLEEAKQQVDILARILDKARNEKQTLENLG